MLAPIAEFVLPFSLIPPIPYLAKASLHGKVIFDGHEHYIKQTVRNRYHVLTANGVKALAIPAVGQKGVKTPTANIGVDYSKPWLRDHLRTIEAAYRSAPFYEHYIDKVTAILNCEADTFGTFFEFSIPRWLEMLKIELDYKISAQYISASRNVLNPFNIKSPSDFPDDTPSTSYVQVFSDRYGFQPHLSILDLVFNEGPEASRILLNG